LGASRASGVCQTRLKHSRSFRHFFFGLGRTAPPSASACRKETRQTRPQTLAPELRALLTMPMFAATARAPSPASMAASTASSSRPIFAEGPRVRVRRTKSQRTRLFARSRNESYVRWSDATHTIRSVSTRARENDKDTDSADDTDTATDEGLKGASDDLFGSHDDEKNRIPESPSPKKPKQRTPMTGMGTRYVDVPIEDISVGALVIASLLAITSAVAVGYLVVTAPSKYSPQFQRRDGLDAVKLGVVEESAPRKAPDDVA
jgi:hypothetical protein